jgi:hypothetical protein
MAAAIAVTREPTPYSLGQISLAPSSARCAERTKEPCAERTNEPKREPFSPSFMQFLLGQGAVHQWSATGSASIRVQVELNGDHWRNADLLPATSQYPRRRTELTTIPEFAVRC